MKNIFVVLIVGLNFSMMAQTKAKIIYVGDPMCSWCYGIAPEFSKLMKEYNQDLDFELVPGGLRPYNEQVMTELKDFLTGHWNEVHERSGQEFNYKILDNTTITYDTEPPSRAAIVVRQLSPKNEIDFFKKSQVLFYKENKNMHLAESYYALLDEYRIDKEEFTTLYNSEEIKRKIKDDFYRASSLGVNSFPTILLEYDGKITPIARGYSTGEKMIEKVEGLMH